MKQSPRIAILGAGPSGLALARVLQKNGMECQIFEKELSTADRDQGGSLDMKEDSGQKALRMAGAHEAFLQLARFEGQESRLMNPQGELLMHEKSPDDDHYMPEIDRGELRSILLDGLKPGTVHWGCSIREVKACPGDTYALQLLDRLSEPFDLVVGADGAWSKVRSLLSPAEPIYSGVMFLQVGLCDVDRHAPALSEMVGHGHLFALGKNKGILAQRSSHGYVRVYFAMRKPHALREELLPIINNPSRMKSFVRDEYKEFAAGLLAILDRCDDQFVLRPIYALPVGHRWTHRPGLTVIGDSAHLMSPFSGMGANLALLDGAELGMAIVAACERGGNLTEAVHAFEIMMQNRAEPEAMGAAEGIDGAISENGLEDSLVHFQNAQAE